MLFCYYVCLHFCLPIPIHCRGISKNRLLIVAAVVIVLAIIALGLGLGLTLNRGDSNGGQGSSCHMNQDGEQTTTPKPNNDTESPSIEGHYRFATVAADAAECSTIGTEIMARDGGSAIDAAIAAILCVGIHNAMSCGIGGGHFLTYYQRSTRKVYTILAREMAPQNASENMFVSANVSSQHGGMSIGVPGEIKGLYEAWKLGGKLPWYRLFQPAIKLCKEGFKVGRSLASAINSTVKFYSNYTNLRELVTNPVTKTYYKEGDTMTRPKLARTLEIIANEGPDAFYNGSLSENITLDIQDAGGIITMEDLMKYTAIKKEPLNITLYDQSVVFAPPPPSSGAVYLFILNILNGYNFTERSIANDRDAILFWHRVVEGFKHAYSLRTQLADDAVESDSFKQYIKELVHNMTSLGYGQLKRSKIDDNFTFGTDYYEPKFGSKDDHGTSHLSVLGPNGDAVAVTSTINLFFGSKVVGSRTGIIFNDEMDDFSTPNTTNAFGVPASPSNFIKPGKRPFSSMSPSIIIDSEGEVRLVVGASGGTLITTATALVTMETLWLKWGIKQAIDYPRIHHQLVPARVDIDQGFPQVIIDGLRAKGHNVTMKPSADSRVQGILQRGKDNIYANSDYRKFGVPDGY
ncbi:hypothetical protein ACJMK2_012037 [Sinanodonta woodiana]|uniref:Uncharacterized protein n=1 Tax=Sinanodonta woodiana TaxID=1069815 RepID=A0ABD3V6X3_SINWO